MPASPRAVAVATLALALGLGATSQGPAATAPASRTPRSSWGKRYLTAARRRPSRRSAGRSKLTSTRSTPRAASTGARSGLSASTTGSTRPRQSSRRASWSRASRCSRSSARWGRAPWRSRTMSISTRCPTCFSAIGAKEWDDFRRFPWSIAFLPTLRRRAEPSASTSPAATPRRKSRCWLETGSWKTKDVHGLQQVLKRGGSPEIVAIATHEMADPDRRFTDLHAAGFRRRCLRPVVQPEGRRPGDSQAFRHPLAAGSPPELCVQLDRVGPRACGTGTVSRNRDHTAFSSSPPIQPGRTIPG